jgi:AcrR family transcriptional regulator
MRAMGAKAKQAGPADGTRIQLMLAAERLFAELGIDSVSLRQINNAAGQRNSSAAHYHFGSKGSLVAAILAYRMEQISARRSRLLARVADATGAARLRGLVEALLLPFVEEMEENPESRNYIFFLAQLIGLPTTDVAAVWRCQFDEQVGHVYAGLREALPAVPDEVFTARYGLLWIVAIKALAERERANGSVLANGAVPALFTSNLVDVLVGLISAPVSGETAAEINALRLANSRPGAA